MERKDRPKYSNKHLVEVVCAFQFPKETKTWDNTLFGIFYEKIELDFPERQTRKGFQIKFNANPSEPINSDISSAPIEDQMIFQNKEKGRAIVMGNRSLSFHATKDYKGWEDFTQKFINPAISSYQKSGLGNGPKTCAVIYMNRFLTLENEPSDYFSIINKIEEEQGEEIVSMVQRTFKKDSNTLVAKLNSQKTNEGLTVIFECGAITSLNDLDPLDLAEQAHLPIRDFFENITTKKLKSIL